MHSIIDFLWQSILNQSGKMFGKDFDAAAAAAGKVSSWQGDVLTVMIMTLSCVCTLHISDIQLPSSSSTFKNTSIAQKFPLK